MRETKYDRVNILFVTPAPDGFSPSQRFRHEQCFQVLRDNGINFAVSAFYSVSDWKILYQNGFLVRKMSAVVLGCIKRFFLLFRLSRYSHIYVHREATPIGPAFFEWCTARLLKKKLIYDFDDAIWLPISSRQNRLAAPFRNFSKVGRICKWSSLVSVGNPWLAKYAGQFTKKVRVIPTVVDTGKKYNLNQDQKTRRPSIGWTGSFSTLAYLDMIVPVLQDLSQSIDFDFIVIADKDPQLPLKNYKFFPWGPDTEVTDLLRSHIGVMPLYNDEVSKGKCGFKAIQYMSVGIPVLVSPVGVNSEIVDDGKNGFICDGPSEWKQCLERLLKDEALRISMGLQARKTILESYSVEAIAARFLSLFDI